MKKIDLDLYVTEHLHSVISKQFHQEIWNLIVGVTWSEISNVTFKFPK